MTPAGRRFRVMPLAPGRRSTRLRRLLALILAYSTLAGLLQGAPLFSSQTTPDRQPEPAAYANGVSPTPSAPPSAPPSTPPPTPGSPTATATSTPPPPPPPTGTVGLPTPAPTVTVPPDVDYVDQAIAADRAALLTQLNTLPLLTGGITGTVVMGSLGGRINSAEGGLTLGLLPGFVPPAQAVNVQVTQPTFAPSDPRATRNGQPLAYTYALTATTVLTGGAAPRFQKDVDLVWHIDPTTLGAAGVRGWPLRVYTFDERQSAWIEILSRWDATTNELIATTPHFSLYAVGDGFDAVNNYLPTVNNFETNLQSGTAAIQYPLNLPPGPGGFAPKVSLSYNSGAVDRVDASQQGPSNVGWGWTLSTSYIAATQHHFPAHPPQGVYEPWTASIAVDGVNGDLVQGALAGPTATPTWHTADESFVKVLYHDSDPSHPNPSAGCTTARICDWWEGWTKDGTHYVFDLNVLTMDIGADPNQQGLTSYRWMLHTATDIHNNSISYSYKYETNSTPGPTPLPTQPPVNQQVRAIYPDQISYGSTDRPAAGTPNPATSKVQVIFTVVPRAINGVTDMGATGPHTGQLAPVQSWRVSGVAVQRQQQALTPGPSPTPAILRAYEFAQSYNIVLYTPTPRPTGTPTPTPTADGYPHLTLDGIIQHGQGNAGQLPTTSFAYYSDAQPEFPTEDRGHLYYAYNGYGGKVGFYYDAAGANLNQAYRRVRAKRIKDGLEQPDLTDDPPHNVAYFYDYRGAALNTPNLSAEVAAQNDPPRHAGGAEFRGFAWAQEIDPQKNATQHYFTQIDDLKAKEWRAQVGKTEVFREPMNNPPTPNAEWTMSPDVLAGVDPLTPSNPVWALPDTNASLLRQPTIGDGSDVAIRLLIQSHGQYPNAQFGGTWKLENANGNGEYWGLQVYPIAGSDVPALQAKVIWGTRVGATLVEGARDLAPGTSNLPQRSGALPGNIWYRLQLHTSPDGRFALELYRDDGPQSDYIQIKSSDLDDAGQPIPTLPTGQAWRFHQVVTRDDQNDFAALADDYSETRSVWSQSDQVYTVTPLPALPFAYDFHVGQNNCKGMDIRFAAPAESRNALYGAASNPAEAGTTRRSKTTYSYDGYGNQTAQYEYGNLDTPDASRNTQTTYALLDKTVSGVVKYLVDKPAESKTYEGLTTGTLAAWQRFYYDNQATPGYIPDTGQGLLTKLQRVDLTNPSGPGSAQQFGYDAYGNKTSETDPDGHAPTLTQFDVYYQSFPAQVTRPGQPPEATTYDFSKDTVSETTDMNGTVTHQRTDAFGRPLKNWTEGYGSDTQPNESYSFPDLNQASVAVPFAITYQRLLTNSPAPVTTSWQQRWFDGMGRTLQDVSPKGDGNVIVVDSTYTNTGQIADKTLPYQAPNPNPNPSASPTGTVTPAPNATPVPRLTKYYDGALRVTMDVNPDGSAVVYSYDRLQWVGTRNETSTQIKWQHTDMLGRMDATVEAQPLGLVPDMETQYKYDALDRQVAAIRDYTRPGTRTTTSISYDGLGHKRQMSDPDMGVWQYRYDAAGNLTEQQDALFGQDPLGHPEHDLFFAYDALNRVTAKYYGAAHQQTGLPDVKYYYDNALQDAASAHSWGQVRAAEVTLQSQPSTANAHRYAYDTRGLLVSDVLTTTSAYSSRAYVLSYDYDAAGRAQTLTYPNPEGEQVTAHYNGQGGGLPDRLTSSLGLPNPVDSAAYNERGQLQTLAQGSGPAYGDMLTTSFSYDEATTRRGWLTEIRATTSSATLLDLHQHYTLNGNIDTVGQDAPNPGPNNPQFTNSYTYDPFDRLQTATSSNATLFPSQSDQFDTLGRLTSRTLNGTAYAYTYAAPGHVDAPSAYARTGDSYSYDANGSQVGRSGGPEPQTRSFDAENRLVGLTQTPRDLSPPTTSSFIYDANGVRLIASVTVGGGSPTRTLYIGALYEEQLTGGANPPYIVYYFLGARAVGLRRANQTPTPTNGQYRLVGDHLGSTTLLVDTSAPPQVAQRQYYTAYGEQAFQYTANSSLTSVNFTGQRLDTGSGLLYYGARFYDPQLSYFLAADTIAPDKGQPQSGDRYSYVLNNPLRYADPTGRCVHSTGLTTAGQIADCDKIESEFKTDGIELEGAWQLDELRDVIQGVRDLMTKAGWSVADFKKAMGADEGRRLIFSRQVSPDFWARVGGAEDGTPSFEFYDFHRNANLINFYDVLLNNLDSEWHRKATVHELAHAWDSSSHDFTGRHDTLSQGIDNFTGASYRNMNRDPFSMPYDVYEAGEGQRFVSGYHPNQVEDFAESVAAAVYPDWRGFNLGPGTSDRLEFVRQQFANYRH